MVMLVELKPLAFLLRSHSTRAGASRKDFKKINKYGRNGTTVWLDMRSNFTSVWEDGNNTWQNPIKAAFVATNCLVLLVTLQAGILANVFVAWAVHHQKSLQTANNALLVNLAIVDLLRCSVDCPLLLSIALRSRGASEDLGQVFCGAQLASFSLFCCVQLLTLACISAERYQAVARPFKHAERRKRVAAWLVLSWTVPISISALCVVFAKDSPVYLRCRGLRTEWLDSYDTFGFYILTPVWCVCLVVIVGFYGRIFLLVRAHGRRIFDKGCLPPPPPQKKQDQPKTNPNFMDRKIHTVDLKPPEDQQGGDQSHQTAVEASAGGEIVVSGTANDEDGRLTSVKAEDVLEAPRVNSPSALGIDVESKVEPSSGGCEDKPNVLQNIDIEHSKGVEDGRDPSPSTNGENAAVVSHREAEETSPVSNGAQNPAAPEGEVVGAVCMMPSLAQRERGNAKKESKLAKRSGYIIFTFLVFWIPLIVMVVCNHLFYQNSNVTMEVLNEMEILTVSLVCMTSLTNPIIYAAVNPQFRNEFRNLKTKWKAFFKCS